MRDIYAKRVSVVEPVWPAVRRAGRMLFRPFDIGKWFVIGLSAWLAGLLSGGTGGSFNLGKKADALKMPGWVGTIMANRELLLSMIAGVIVLGATVLVLILWLKSRGQFMFLHCVAKDRAEIVEPWHEYRREAKSLFWLRICFAGAAVLAFAAAVAIGAWAFINYGQREEGFPWRLLLMGIPLIGPALMVSMAVVVFLKFVNDFAVPIMYLRRCGFVDAWREFWELLSSRFWSFVLYLLFQAVIGIGVGLAVSAVILASCCTCCILFVLMMLPYIGTVVLLPIYVFLRAYPLYFLRQFGREYDAIEESPSGLL